MNKKLFPLTLWFVEELSKEENIPYESALDKVFTSNILDKMSNTDSTFTTYMPKDLVKVYKAERF
jgi:hypothetical protein